MTSHQCPNHLRMQRCLEKYGWPIKPCGYCTDGTVQVDEEAIVAALIVKGRFRASRPKAAGFDHVPGRAPVFGAAYVWRMIRFHNGQDMHMPVLAPDYVGGSENKELMAYLDQLVDRIGERIFGKVAMMRGAGRWGRALGLPGADAVCAVVEATVGMPMGNGSAIGGFDESPEAFVEEHLTETGELEELGV